MEVRYKNLNFFWKAYRRIVNFPRFLYELSLDFLVWTFKGCPDVWSNEEKQTKFTNLRSSISHIFTCNLGMYDVRCGNYYTTDEIIDELY